MGKKDNKRNAGQGSKCPKRLLNVGVQNQYNEILIHGTWQQLKRSIVKNRAEFYAIPDFTFEIMFHQARAKRPGIPSDLVLSSLRWLKKHGINVTRNTG